MDDNRIQSQTAGDSRHQSRTDWMAMQLSCSIVSKMNCPVRAVDSIHMPADSTGSMDLAMHKVEIQHSVVRLLLLVGQLRVLLRVFDSGWVDCNRFHSAVHCHLVVDHDRPNRMPSGDSYRQS